MRRRTQLQHEEHGYLASISDLMSGLMFIFIITLVVFALALLNRERQRQQEVDLLTGSRQEMHNLLADVQERLQQEGIAVSVVSDQGVLRLGERLLFASASATLDDKGLQTVHVLARILDDVLPCYTRSAPASLTDAVRVTGTASAAAGAGVGDVAKACGDRGTRGRVDALFIEGHTDNQPIRMAFKDNWDLSMARAKAIYEALTKEPSNLDSLINDQGQPILSLTGYAHRREVDSNATEEGRARNRRIDLRFVMTPPRDAAPPEPAQATERDLQS